MEQPLPPPNSTEPSPTKQPSFEGPELLLKFSETETEVTFIPRKTLKGADWSYPYPKISSDLKVVDLVNLFGEDFTYDILQDGLVKYCQNKWKSSEGSPSTFQEIFFDRRSLEPTPAKLSLELTKKMAEFKKLKDLKGKDHEDVKNFAKEVIELRDTLRDLERKEMENL